MAPSQPNRLVDQRTVGNGKNASLDGVRVSRRSGLRWLLLLLFTVGYLVTYNSFSTWGLEYLTLSLASVLACGLLLTRLRAGIEVTFPVWVLLTIFCLNYYFQFYVLVFDPTLYPGHAPSVDDASESLLADAYGTTALAFGTFCLIAWAMLGMEHKRRSPAGQGDGMSSVAGRPGQFAIAPLLLTILPLELVTAYVSWREGVAVMGAESAVLPYRLAGVVFYTRLIILPGLMLVLAWLTDHPNSKGRFRLAVTLLLFHGVLDAVLRSSRSSLFIVVSTLLFLLLLTHRLTRQRFRFAAVGLVLSFISFPVLTEYRYLRAAGEVSDITRPLAESIGVYDTGGPDDTLTGTVWSLTFRLGGVACLLPIIATRSEPLGILNAGRVNDVLNREILFMPESQYTTGAPSLVGWFYLLGGNGGVVLGILAFAAAMQAVWRALSSSRLRSRPAAQGLFLVVLVLVANDGVLEGSLWSWFAVAVTVGASELLLRISGVRNERSCGTLTRGW